jgi:uncharacterized repeat protein (TIGR03803 family)
LCDCGVIFKLDPTDVETVLYGFTGGADGDNPLAGLLRDAAGNLYGTAGGGTSGNGVVFKLSPSGAEKVLYSFTGGGDGGKPTAGLIEDLAGNLYGTTTYGGIGCGNYGCGTVFKLIRCGSEPSGYEFKVLHRFTGGADGGFPYASLIRDAAGNLYGTTYSGGSSSLSGTVFKLSPDGTETILHRFTGGADGAFPQAGLIRDSAGNLYGATFAGGLEHSRCGYVGFTSCGVVFKVSPTDGETVLYSFTGGGDGAGPVAGLLRDAGGNLYGTTSAGGAKSSTCPYSQDGSCGVVFKLSPTGIETVLHSFTGGDGSYPLAGLIPDLAGNLYGTTLGGGGNGPCGGVGCGVVFKLTP